MATTSTRPTLTDLKATWGRRDYSTNPMSRAVINLLANGAPVTPTTLAAATGMSIRETEAFIDNARRRGVEVQDGAIVGLALSLRATEHRFRVRGHDLSTWCGFDAMFVPMLVDEQAQVASTCPVTGTPIRLTVEADGTVSAATPADVVVAIVGDAVTSSCSVAGHGSMICGQMPFFASREVGERWQTDHPGVAVVDLDAARQVARAYVHHEGALSHER